jgi:hypothetical protein
MRIDDAEASLRGYLSGVGLGLGRDEVRSSMVTMMDWYAHERVQDAAPIDQDGDMLLFEWGVHDRGAGPAFEYGLTRQFIRAADEEDEGIVQLAVTYRYPPTDVAGGLGAGHSWCRSPAELTAFRQEVEAHPASEIARSSVPLEVSVRCEVAG